MGQIALLEKRGSRCRWLTSAPAPFPPSMRRKSGVCMAGGARFEEGLEGQAWGHGEKDGGFTLQSGLQNALELKRGLC